MTAGEVVVRTDVGGSDPRVSTVVVAVLTEKYRSGLETVELLSEVRTDSGSCHCKCYRDYTVAH